MKPKVKILETQGSSISLESQINQFLQKIDVDGLLLKLIYVIVPVSRDFDHTFYNPPAEHNIVC